MLNEYKYQRVLIKFSGESLSGQGETGYATDAIKSVVERVEKVIDRGVEVALVVGAGNIWRGVNGSDWGMDRVTADYMGMLATVMNALCLRDAFDSAGIAAEVFTSIPMKPVAEPFDRRQAIKAMESGKVVIFAGGTGSPFFTTDTTATLRALETNCEAVLKATKVDGVYTDDPFKNPAATRYETLSFADALSQRLAIMDSTAFSMCRDNSLPIIVFNFSEENGLDMVLRGDTTIATLIS